ncbi:non-canonical purine NTP pyrophosphatase [Candidatus Uhrbacteria bacterium]|nr:non-canonical purine NTP pyrophosphatase [Candidatus Uhrbacteria bacterium]
MSVKFITGSRHKFAEVVAIVGDGVLEQVDIDLPEIQEVDPKAVIEAKLREAMRHGQEGGLIVEDTSLFLDCLSASPDQPGLPGPLVKWFVKTVGQEGLWQLADRFGVYGAEARTTIGLACGPKDTRFFEGITRGTIVAPRGESDFGWDRVFRPEGRTKTFAEMDREEKNGISHRGKAVRLLRDYLVR